MMTWINRIWLATIMGLSIGMFLLFGEVTAFVILEDGPMIVAAIFALATFICIGMLFLAIILRSEMLEERPTAVRPMRTRGRRVLDENFRFAP
jgi:hypothetical protein